MERRVRAPVYPSYLYYHSEIIQADKALMAAHAAGKDRECPAEYNAAKAEVDQAYAVYHACRTREAIGIANNALEKIKGLCPSKPVPPPPPPPPPPPAPEPAPVPAPKKVIETLTLNINFDVNKAAIRAADEADLKKAIDFVRKYLMPSFVSKVTDDVGTASYNQQLSEKRAEAVRRYLVTKSGFDNTRFSTAGFGETKPIDSNKTKEGRFRNRRVEISAVSE